MSGCSAKNLGISSSSLMSKELPQSLVIPSSVNKVWDQVVSHAKTVPGGRILAMSPKDRLISWCEKVENWQDLGTDTARAKDAVLAGVAKNPDIFANLVANTGEGVAITTVWIEAMGRRSRVHIRRVTYGDKSFAGMGHSRGDYERSFYRKISTAIAR